MTVVIRVKPAGHQCFTSQAESNAGFNISSAFVRLLVDTVVHFPPSLEEVTVSVNDERMWVRNHVEEHGTLVSVSTRYIHWS